MGKYIEREAAIAALDEFRLNQTVSKYATVMQCRAARDAISRATKALESLPAADVEPVRHGRWKLIGADNRGRGGVWECTGRDGCGRLYPYKCDFCPNCGARMDEEVDHAQE